MLLNTKLMLIFDVMLLLYDIIWISNPNIKAYINYLSSGCLVFVSF